MLFFVVRGFQKQGGNLLIAFFLGNGGEVGVLVACLGFAGKSGFQILFRLGTCVLAHGGFLPFLLAFFVEGILCNSCFTACSGKSAEGGVSIKRCKSA